MSIFNPTQKRVNTLIESLNLANKQIRQLTRNVASLEKEVKSLAAENESLLEENGKLISENLKLNNKCCDIRRQLRTLQDNNVSVLLYSEQKK